MPRKIFQPKRHIKTTNIEGVIFLFFFSAVFIPLLSTMGVANFFQTIMSTAHDLLINTVFFLLAVAVLTGAIGALISEFGVVQILDVLLSKLMKPLYKLPGIAIVGVITTYLSDNPAIIALAKDKTFLSFFKKRQIPLLCNLGTSFGMGLIISTFMIAQGTKLGIQLFVPVLIGNIGAIIGSIVSVRMMTYLTRNDFSTTEDDKINMDLKSKRVVREGTVFHRILSSLLDGGQTGVNIGLGIIPGVLIVSTFVMLLTFGPKDPSIGYQGIAYEGVGFLPWIGEQIFPVINFLFGFESPQLIAFPLTTLGSAGAALALVPKFVNESIINPNDIAVFTAMGMCWSGYLSTHIAMMDALDFRSLTNKALLSHTISGLAAGITAHFMAMLFI